MEVQNLVEVLGLAVFVLLLGGGLSEVVVLVVLPPVLGISVGEFREDSMIAEVRVALDILADGAQPEELQLWAWTTLGLLELPRPHSNHARGFGSSNTGIVQGSLNRSLSNSVRYGIGYSCSASYSFPPKRRSQSLAVFYRETSGSSCNSAEPWKGSSR